MTVAALFPECPGPDCMMCNGKACDKCGAGCWNNDPDRPKCEHDVMQRHEAPSARPNDGRETARKDRP